METTVSYSNIAPGECSSSGDKRFTIIYISVPGEGKPRKARYMQHIYEVLFLTFVSR